MEEHLRFAVCYWHNFVWEGNDPFGGQTFQRPWFPADTMELARAKADAAFDMFRILGVPFFCFHDHDVRPEGSNLAESHKRLNEMADYFEKKMAEGGPRLLWGRRTCSQTGVTWPVPAPTPTRMCSPIARRR